MGVTERRHHLDVRVVVSADGLTSLMGEVIRESEVAGHDVKWRELEPARERPFIVRVEGDLETLWAILRVMLLRVSRFEIIDVDCDYGSEGEEP